MPHAIRPALVSLMTVALTALAVACGSARPSATATAPAATTTAAAVATARSIDTATAARTASPAAPAPPSTSEPVSTPPALPTAGPTAAVVATGPKCAYHGVLPDPVCTPGAADPAVTQSNIDATICVPGYASSVRPSSQADRDRMFQLKLQEMSDYGVGDRATGDFEQDHLIPLELGGAPRDPLNLWPESFDGGDNARNKDQVENGLHDAVCAGRVSLATAQHAIASDWLAAFALFGTAPPTPAPDAATPGAAGSAACAAAASISNATPARFSTVTVTGRLACGGAPASGVAMTATWHYKTTSPTCAAVSGDDGTASCSRSIGGASAGYAVAVDVCFDAPDGAACAQTGFTPH